MFSLKTISNRKSDLITFTVLFLISFSSLIIKHPFHFTAVLASGFAFQILNPNNKYLGFGLSIFSYFVFEVFNDFSFMNVSFYPSTILAFLVLITFQKSDLFGNLKATVIASLTFFLVSNSFVFFEGVLYPMNLSGYFQCLYMGIPFYKWQIAADVLGTLLLVKLVSTLQFSTTGSKIKNHLVKNK